MQGGDVSKMFAYFEVEAAVLAPSAGKDEYAKDGFEELFTKIH